jgi:hypothetical protein
MNEIEYQMKLGEQIAEFKHDPYGYMCFNFPWGENDLESAQGPREWQAEIAKYIGKELKRGKKIIRIAVASGHDIGKSALINMLQKWALDTMNRTKCLITANTGSQLKTKTWAELSKWHRLSLTNSWFEITATSMYSSQEKYRLEWKSDQAIWRDNNTAAFAGFHNQGSRIFIAVDEASGIPRSIWETIDSFCLDKDTEIIVLAFGNPLQKSGGFFDIFENEVRRRESDLEPIWKTYNICSQGIEGVDQDEIQKLIDTHGWDSDYVKSRIRGLFPNASSLQFFPSDLVMRSRKQLAQSTVLDPLICGLDIARGGQDNCVFYFRKGLDGKTIAPIVIPGSLIHDSVKFAEKAIEIFETYKPDEVFGDSGGLGAPTLDIIRRLGWEVLNVNFGGEQKDKYFNKTAEMAAKLKQWMKDGGSIFDDADLQEQLCNRLFGDTIKGQLKLESKDDMKKRGLDSPDMGDALFLTFAYPVAMKGKMRSKPINMVTTLDEYKCLTKKK